MAYPFAEVLILAADDPRLPHLLALAAHVDAWTPARVVHALGIHPPDRADGCDPPTVVAVPGRHGNTTAVTVPVWDMDDRHIVTPDPDLEQELIALHESEPAGHADTGRALLRALAMGLRSPGCEFAHGLRLQLLYARDGGQERLSLLWGTGHTGEVSDGEDPDSGRRT